MVFGFRKPVVSAAVGPTALPLLRYLSWLRREKKFRVALCIVASTIQYRRHGLVLERCATGRFLQERPLIARLLKVHSRVTGSSRKKCSAVLTLGPLAHVFLMSIDSTCYALLLAQLQVIASDLE